jgi:hypothetical protein
MRPGGRDQRAALRGCLAKSGANVTDFMDSLGHVRCNAGRRLEHGRHQLGPDALVGRSLGNLVEARHELVALRRDELELLLDAEAERPALAESVLHDCSLPTHRMW